MSYDWACEPENNRRLMAVTQRLHEKPWPLTIVPAFSWGDHSILGDRLKMSADVEYVDVSPLARRYDIPKIDPAFRQRRWVLGTVSNQLSWLESLGLTWPLEHIGTKTSRAPVKMPESELVAKYGANWGVLSPPYKAILGSGWWRNRFVYSARASAIMLCDPFEAHGLGLPYQLNQSGVEELTAQELNEIALSQADAFFQRQPHIDAVSGQLRDAVKWAIAAAR